MIDLLRKFFLLVLGTTKFVKKREKISQHNSILKQNNSAWRHTSSKLSNSSTKILISLGGDMNEQRNGAQLDG